MRHRNGGIFPIWRKSGTDPTPWGRLGGPRGAGRAGCYWQRLLQRGQVSVRLQVVQFVPQTVGSLVAPPTTAARSGLFRPSSVSRLRQSFLNFFFNSGLLVFMATLRRPSPEALSPLPRATER